MANKISGLLATVVNLQFFFGINDICCRYTRPRSQLVITCILTFIEVLINGAWLLKAPPSATYTFPTRDTRLRICQGFDDRSYMIGLIYPFILIGESFKLKRASISSYN